MSNACTPILVGMVFLVSEILLLFISFNFAILTMDYGLPYKHLKLVDKGNKKHSYLPLIHPPSILIFPCIVCPMPIPIKENDGTENMLPVAQSIPDTILNEKNGGCFIMNILIIRPTSQAPIPIIH